jgi:tripartite-type tricarboxylate transporter receptor subunit TctC
MQRILAAALALLAASAAGIVTSVATSSAEERYPSRTVRLLCWTSAGAPLDVMMRQLGKQLGVILGQTFVVDNRAGASGAVAMSALMGQPPDGYSILSTTSSMSFTMASTALPYTASDFTVLPALQAEPSAVAVRADSRFKSLKDLIAFLRENPDKLSVGGFSAGGFHQFVFHRLQQEGHFKATWIPFKGGQEAGMALLGGHIDVAVLTPSSALAQIQNGDIRLLGISSEGRDQYFPDVPTFKEQGLDVVERIWRGVMLKAGTPRPVIDTLISAIDRMKQTQEWKDFSRINLQSAMEISLGDMQTLVANEISSDRAFLRSSGLLK